jgi:hypothetical protein
VNAATIADADYLDRPLGILGRKFGSGTEAGSCWTREALTSQNAVPTIRHHQVSVGKVEVFLLHGAIIRSREEAHHEVHYVWKACSHPLTLTRNGGTSPHLRLENDHTNGDIQIAVVRESLNITESLVHLTNVDDHQVLDTTKPIDADLHLRISLLSTTTLRNATDRLGLIQGPLRSPATDRLSRNREKITGGETIRYRKTVDLLILIATNHHIIALANNRRVHREVPKPLEGIPQKEIEEEDHRETSIAPSLKEGGHRNSLLRVPTVSRSRERDPQRLLRVQTALK